MCVPDLAACRVQTIFGTGYIQISQRVSLNMRLTKLTLVLSVFTACLALAPAVSAATSSASRWVVVLNEPPAVRKYPGRIERTRAASEPYRQHLRQVQTNMRSQIESTHARVTGAVQHLLNGVF